MDPFTAIGLASSIVQFVDYGTRLLCDAREIYTSVSGSTDENKSIETVTAEMKALSAKLSLPPASAQTEDEKALRRIATECESVSSEILSLLAKIRSPNPKSKLRSVWSALQSKMHQAQKLDLQNRLRDCRDQLDLQLNVLNRFAPSP